MVRWIIALVFVCQASTALAQDRCGSANIASGNINLSVAAEQRGPRQALMTNTFVVALSHDEQMRFLISYAQQPDGRIAPGVFHINTAPTEDVRPELIKWRRNDGEWKIASRPPYPRTIGDFSFMVAQRVQFFESFDRRPEELDELRLGGRYTVARTSESGEELATGVIEYPDEAAINALYTRALQQAVAKLSVCKPRGVMRASQGN